MSIGRGAAREVLVGIAAMPAPEPRAGFVRDLEMRLGKLIESSARGDLVPEIEVAPPSKPMRSSARMRTLATVAVCAAALAVGLSTASMGTLSSREVATGAGSARERTSDAEVVDVTAGLEDASGTPTSPLTDGSPVRHRLSRSSSGSATGDDISTDSSAPSTAPSSTSSTAPAGASVATTKPGHDDQRATMGLSASGTPARVFLSWDRYEGDDFAAYLVLRANGPDTPDQPDASGRTLMLLRIENAQMTTHQDTPKVGIEPRYRVIVVRRNGTVAAKSPAVVPTTPLSATSASVDLAEL